METAANRYWEHLDAQAVKVVLAAQEESRRLGHKTVDTEFVLLSLLTVEKDGLAGEILSKLGLKQQDLRKQIKDCLGQGNDYVGVETPFSDRLNRLMESAYASAAKAGSLKIAPLHLLSAFAQVQEGLAGQILSRALITPESLQAKITELSSSSIDFS